MAKRHGAQTRPTALTADIRPLALTIGWYLFIAMIVVMPLIIGAFPVSWGSIAQLRAGDPLVLPKFVALVVLSSLSLVSFLFAVLRGEVEMRWHPALWVVIALTLWTGVSAAFTSYPWHGVLGGYGSNDGVVAMLSYATVAFLAMQYVRTQDSARALASAAVLSGVLVSIYALMQFWGADPFNREQAVRVFSTFGNPDMLADYLVFPFTLSLGLALALPASRGRLAAWTGFGLLSAVLLASGTRGGWLGGAVALTIVGATVWRAAREGRHLPLGKIIAAAAAVIAAVGAWIWYAQPLVGRQITLSNGLLGATSGRTIIWETGIRAWLARPVTGWGPDAFGRAFDFAAQSDWFGLVQGLLKADTAHSIAVQLLATIGLPGLLLFAWAMVWALVAARGVLRRGSGHGVLGVAAWATVVGLVVALMFGVTQPPVTVWLWMSLGVLLAYAQGTVPVRPSGMIVWVPAVSAAMFLMAVWSVTWLVADYAAGSGQQLNVGDAQVQAFEQAAAVNPVSADYRWLVGEAVGELGNAYHRAGRGDLARPLADRSIVEYRRAMAIDPGDDMLRVAAAGNLLYYARTYGVPAAGNEAVSLAESAVQLAPNGPAALTVLAQAYQAIGRMPEAEQAARRARELSPGYANSALGTLGETTTTP